jgi:hypothetical protein
MPMGNMFEKCPMQIFSDGINGKLLPHKIKIGVQRGNFFPSYSGGQPNYHYDHNSCVMAISMSYVICVTRMCPSS